MSLLPLLLNRNRSNRPTLNLEFTANPVPASVTFTRATSRTYTNSAGLLAKSTYNLLTYSEDISNAAYSKLAVSITANTTTAPDGTVTADKMAEDATLSTHKIQQSVNTTNTNPHCFSVYVKAAENTFCVILLQETVTFLRYSFVVVNLSAGTISATTDSGGAASTASIAPVGGGWYRVSLVSTLGGVNPAMLAQVFNGNGVTSYTGVAGNGIYIWGAQLEASPAAGPYWATTTAANGAPAIDYDPVTLACRGLSIWEARTNLLKYSEQFDNAAWTKQGSSITANAVTAPDGATTADKLIESAANTVHYVYQFITQAANTTNTISVYVKAAERGYVGLHMTPDGTNYVYCTFNVSAGTASAPVNSGNGSGATASIASVGNGWYRCSLSGIASSTVANPLGAVYVGSSNTNLFTTPYLGDGTSGIYIWGAQLE